MKTRCCCSKRYLLVFSILLVSVGSIFMSVSLSSCSSPSVKNQLLLCADSLMETYPLIPQHYNLTLFISS